jgi:Rrf2 family transcriptional regulator, iron-sulfur cluster assembly transcription factor
MLRINRQTDYAVRVVLALAKQGEGIRLSTAAIQRDMQIPAGLMPRIVAHLARTGLLRTFTGRDGGLSLSRPAGEITLRDVVEAFEGPILLSRCLQFTGDGDCPFQMTCPVRTKWGRVQAAMLREMASITFADLALEALSLPVLVQTAIP